MDRIKVLVLGEALPAEGIARALAGLEEILFVAQARTLMGAQHLMAEAAVDVVILIDDGRQPNTHLAPLLNLYPGLPIIRANIDSAKVQIITSRCADASLSGLIDAIASTARGGDTAFGQQANAQRRSGV